jgi:hypothetical protein
MFYMNNVSVMCNNLNGYKTYKLTPYTNSAFDKASSQALKLFLPNLWILKMSFIGRFYLPINLSIIWSKIDYFKYILFYELLHIFLNKYWFLVSSDSFQKSKPVNDMFFNEFEHCFLINLLIRNNFNLLVMSIWWRWVYFSNNIHCPSSK